MNMESKGNKRRYKRSSDGKGKRPVQERIAAVQEAVEAGSDVKFDGEVPRRRRQRGRADPQPPVVVNNIFNPPAPAADNARQPPDEVGINLLPPLVIEVESNHGLVYKILDCCWEMATLYANYKIVMRFLKDFYWFSKRNLVVSVIVYFINSYLYARKGDILKFLIPNHKVYLERDDVQTLAYHDVERHSQNRSVRPVNTQIVRYNYNIRSQNQTMCHQWYNTVHNRLVGPNIHWMEIGTDTVKFYKSPGVFKSEILSLELYHHTMTTRTTNGHVALDRLYVNIEQNIMNRTDASLSNFDYVNKCSIASSTGTIVKYIAKNNHLRVMEMGFCRGSQQSNTNSDIVYSNSQLHGDQKLPGESNKTLVSHSIGVLTSVCSHVSRYKLASGSTLLVSLSLTLILLTLLGVLLGNSNVQRHLSRFVSSALSLF